MCGHIQMKIRIHFYWWSFTLPDIARQNMPMTTMQIVSNTSVKSSAERFLVENCHYSHFQVGEKRVWTYYNENMESLLLVVFHTA